MLDDAVLQAGASTLNNATLNNPTISGWTNAQHTHASAATAGSTLGPNTTLSTPTLQTPGVTGTMTIGGDVTLQRTGAGALRADTNLGVGVNPLAWGSTLRAVQTGGTAAFWADTSTAGTGSAILSVNTYYDGTGYKAVGTSGGASTLTLQQGALTFSNAPTAAAGAAQTFTTRLQVAQTGTVTLTPDAGQAGLSVGTITAPAAAHMLLAPGTGANVMVDPPSNLFLPNRDNAIFSGDGAHRWAAVFAVNGTIQTSSREAKQDVTPLDPAAAMAAVRATEPVTFTYTAPERGPEWYELPDDPEQAADVLYQRLTAAPLEAGARHQAGFVLDDPAYPCDPLFQTGEGQSNAANSVGVLLAALRELDRRLTALETP